MANKFYLILLFLCPLLSVAQSNYKNGYVINLKGDTLHGYIDYKEWGRSPAAINFKSTLNEKALRLGINDINYFEVTGAVSYQKYGVNISLNSLDISAVPPLHDTSNRSDNVFLKIIQKGKYVTLYSYSDAVKNRFYINESNGNAPTELIYGIYQSPGSDNGIVEVVSYRDQLTQLAVKYVGSDKLNGEIIGAKYDESDVRDIIAKVNGDVVTRSSLMAGKNPSIRFFIGAAYEMSTLRYDGESPYAGYYPNVPSTVNSPKITFGMDAFVNPNLGHLVFRLEFAYDQHNGYYYSQTPRDFVVSNGSSKSQNLNQTDFSVTPQAIYNLYNSKALKIFVDVGFVLNFSSYVDKVTIKTANGTTTGNNLDNIAYNSFWTGVQLKAGIVLTKKIEIYGTYSPAASISGISVSHALTSYQANIKSYQVGVNYFFK